MLDAASSSDLAAAVGSSSIPPSATDPAAVTVAAAASSETTSRPPSSVNDNVPTTAMVTTAADNADNARYDPATNVDGGPSPAALGDDADEGTVNTSVQVAVMSIISNAAKLSLLAYFEGENWPLNKALPKGAEFLNGPLGGIMRQFCLVKTQVARQLSKCRDDGLLLCQPKLPP